MKRIVFAVCVGSGYSGGDGYQSWVSICTNLLEEAAFVAAVGVSKPRI